MIGRLARQALLDVEGQGVFELLDRIFTTGEPFVGWAVRISLQRSPGARPEERILDFVCQPIIDGEGRVTGIFVEGSDVTDGARGKAELRESEECLRAIMETARDHAIFTTDVEGRIETWPAGAQAVFDWTAEEAVGQPVDTTFTPEDRAAGAPAAEPDMADHAPVMMRVTDADGACTYLDRAWYEFTGQTTEEAEGFGWLKATHLDDKAGAERVFVAANARAEPFCLEYRLPRHDGEFRSATGADANQLEMALLNLAVNARDAMPDGGGSTLAATYESVRGKHPGGLKRGHYVRLAVIDEGMGMDEATLARTVEPFFSTKGVGRSTGLGLSMVHGLAAQLGGGLTIDSEVGHGTTVALWLPISGVPVSGTMGGHATPGPLASRGCALLVDDEDLMRMSPPLIGIAPSERSRMACFLRRGARARYEISCSDRVRSEASLTSGLAQPLAMPV